MDADKAALEAEMANGKRIARELAVHLRAMNAFNAQFPVSVDDENYVVTIAHIPVIPAE